MDKDCGNCFFFSLKGVSSLAPCYDCKYNRENFNEFARQSYAWTSDRWVTDSDAFWKDKPKEKKMTESYKQDAMRGCTWLHEAGKEPRQVPSGVYSEDLPRAEWPFPAEADHDPIKKPSHYMLFPEKNLEVRDVVNRLLERMEKSEEYDMTPVDYADYAQLMQYLMRWFDKNGKEDLEKARWYLDRLIENWVDHAEPDA